MRGTEKEILGKSEAATGSALQEKVSEKIWQISP